MYYGHLDELLGDKRLYPDSYVVNRALELGVPISDLLTPENVLSKTAGDLLQGMTLPEEIKDMLGLINQAVMAVREGIERGFDVNRRASHPPVIFAALSVSSRSLVREFVRAGAICDAPECSLALTPLHFADEELSEPILFELLNANTNVNVRYHRPGVMRSPSIMFQVTECNDQRLLPHLLKRLAEVGADLNQDDGEGRSLLLYLVSEEVRKSRLSNFKTEWEEAFSVMLDHGASSDVYKSEVVKDLVERIRERGNVRLCQLLEVEPYLPSDPREQQPPLAGLDVDAPNPQPPPHIIVDPHKFVIGRIVSQVDGIRDLDYTDDYVSHHPGGTLERIQQVIREIDDAVEAGHKILERNTNLETALHWAADSGPSAVIRHLLAKGAWPDLGDRQGNTAFHRAIHGENFFGLLSMFACLSKGLPASRLKGQIPWNWDQANNAGDSPLAALARANPPAELWLKLCHFMFEVSDLDDWRAVCILFLRRIGKDNTSSLIDEKTDVLDAMRAAIVAEQMRKGTLAPQVQIFCRGQHLLDYVREQGSPELRAIFGV